MKIFNLNRKFFIHNIIFTKLPIQLFTASTKQYLFVVNVISVILFGLVTPTSSDVFNVASKSYA